jgi:hypothetical protein
VYVDCGVRVVEGKRITGAVEGIGNPHNGTVGVAEYIGKVAR